MTRTFVLTLAVGTFVLRAAEPTAEQIEFFEKKIRPVLVPGVVRVYDDVNATGNLLATLVLPLTPHTGAPDPTGNFRPLVPIGVAFAGIAKSIDFGGTVNQIAFDNVNLWLRYSRSGEGSGTELVPDAC